MLEGQRSEDRKGEIIKVTPDAGPEDMMTQIKKVAAVAKKVVALTDADIIVSGGRGVGGPEGFDIIYKLADKLNGVVGASRVAVDLGWIGFEHQVGQAGATVKPKIYIFICYVSYKNITAADALCFFVSCCIQCAVYCLTNVFTHIILELYMYYSAKVSDCD